MVRLNHAAAEERRFDCHISLLRIGQDKSSYSCTPNVDGHKCFLWINCSLLPQIHRCEGSPHLQGLPTVVHRICLEESLASTAEDIADTLRDRNGDWRIRGPGGVFTRIRTGMVAHLLEQRHRYCGYSADFFEYLVK